MENAYLVYDVLSIIFSRYCKPNWRVRCALENWNNVVQTWREKGVVFINAKNKYRVIDGAERHHSDLELDSAQLSLGLWVQVCKLIRKRACIQQH